MQHCDSTCYHCATVFFLWWKGRVAQFEQPRGKRAQRSGGGNFNEAAATSVRPPRRVRSLAYEHTVEVLHDSGEPNFRGEHWVEVAIRTTGVAEPWVVHVPHGDLE